MDGKRIERRAAEADNPAVYGGDPVLKRFLGLLRPHMPAIAMACFLMCVTVGAQIPIPLIFRYLVDTVASAGSIPQLNVTGMILVSLLSAKELSAFLENRILLSLRSRVITGIRTALYEHIHYLPLSFFMKSKTGYLMSRLGSDVQSLQGLMADTVVVFIQSVLVFVAGIVCTFSISPRLAVVALAIVPVYGAVLAVFNKRIKTRAWDLQEMFAQLQKEVHEAVSGMYLLQAFWAQSVSVANLRGKAEEARRKDVALGFLNTWYILLTGLLSEAGPLVILWLGIRQIISGELTIGGLIAFNSFVGYLFGPTAAIVTVNIGVQQSLAAAQRVFELSDIPRTVESGADCPSSPPSGLSFENVCFSYDGRSVLDGVSFLVGKGERVAIVGPSGAGKTTLFNLILRFYEPDRGAIRLDGRDISAFAVPSLRRRISLVPQNAFLFGTTIAGNVRLGETHATKAEVESACERAEVLPFCASMARGTESVIGERGYSLSGGERQRVAIARAFLRDCDIVLIDEGTTHIDPVCGKILNDRMDEVWKNKILLRISHDIEGIEDFDRIIVMRDGRVIAQGTHEELLVDCELYRKLESGRGASGKTR